MKVYTDLDAYMAIKEAAEVAGIEPDYSSLEYTIDYFTTGSLNIYDYLDRSLDFQDELFTKQSVLYPYYFGADVNE